jgi:hypothetical protein
VQKQINKPSGKPGRLFVVRKADEFEKADLTAPQSALNRNHDTTRTFHISQNPKILISFRIPIASMPRCIAASPVFYWQEYGMWCASGYDQVNALLRDRRLGRENRWGAPLNPVQGRDHLRDFDRIESGRCLNANLRSIRA